VTLNLEYGVLTSAARIFRLLILLDTINLKGYSGKTVTAFFVKM
jgi:hypothetical protein